MVGGAILPHPPIILPSYAQQRGHEADQTIDAVRRACRWIADELKPDRLVITSPHEGHGFDVPLFFLQEVMGTLPPTDRILTDDPSYEQYVVLGQQLRNKLDRTERVAVIASGDCSHRLREDGPYGFHPMGPILDDAIQEGVREASADALLDIDRDVVAQGGECGLRSFIFALAAVEPRQTDILSYEAPYGVGYLVATLVSWNRGPQHISRPGRAVPRKREARRGAHTERCVTRKRRAP